MQTSKRVAMWHNISSVCMKGIQLTLYEYTCQPLTGISDHEIVCLTSVVDVDYHQATIRKVYLWHRASLSVA